MRHKRLRLDVIWPVGLLVLVGALAWLQYRWLGQVSEAERDRLHATLEQRATEFADDFDRELAEVYATFQGQSAALLTSDATGFGHAYDAWTSSARVPEILRAVYLFDASAPDRLREYQPDRHVFEPAAWPAVLESIHRSYAVPLGEAAGGERVQVQFGRTPFLPSIPALVLTLPQFTPPVSEQSLTRMTLHLNAAVLILQLDMDALRTRLLPLLADRYFPAHGIDSYRMEVVDRAHPSTVVFERGVAGGPPIDPKAADADVGLFSLRFDVIDNGRVPSAVVLGTMQSARAATEAVAVTTAAQQHAASPAKTVAPPSGPTGRFSVFIEQRATTADGAADAKNGLWRSAGLLGAPTWSLMLQHASGSLEAAVGQARRRNLTLSFGILAVLAISIGLIAINARRAQRLAAQQMDFVATVSHELRTPLAVIRSAAQNLSAGVVHDAPQAKRYGDLIDAEGRRLTDMVEQVLEFAGLAANRRSVAARPTDMVALVRDLAASCDTLCRDAHVALQVETDPRTPLAAVDEGAVRRALQNLVANAVKYGARGGWIRLAVAPAAIRGGQEVQMSVGDGGPGIDPDDLPHIFDPFYRGRDALDRQVHGNGLGLSLVKRIAEVHGGRVTVASTPGEGATFTLHFPAATPDAAVDAIGAPAPHGPAA